MKRAFLTAWMTLAVVAVPEARADVVVGTGGVGVNASADVRCSDPLGGAVQRPFDGDSTAPYSASVTADVSVPCQHSGVADQHTALAEASATGSFTSGAARTVITGSGTTAGNGHHFFEAGSFTEFNQDFMVTGAPVEYELTVSGLVQLDGGITGSASGTLQPGGHTIRGFANCSVGAGVCGGFSLTLELVVADDTDGDALIDVWETDGIDTDGDGTPELDLPAMGANPRHKDIFLEIDHMTGHGLSQTAVDRVVAAFAAAPVTNPDGRGGITLHVDNGPASRMDPTTGDTWGAESDADELAHATVLGTLAAGGHYDWTAFDGLKAANLRPERAAAFHYLISAHRYGSAATSSSGLSRDFGASDLIVSLGAFSEPLDGSGTVAEQAGTIMHELGHNLGLRHGGDDHGNYEPNYLSIMNYAFQMTGIPRVDGTNVLDYSRLTVNLDERALNENVGFGLAAGTEPAEWLTIFRCPSGTRKWAFLQAALTDWDCSGTAAGIIARDLNGVGGQTALTPFLDWPALVYDGGPIGGGGAALPATTEVVEPSMEELVANAAEVQKAHAESAAGPQLPPKGGGGPGPSASDAAPVLSGVRLNPTAFRAARRGGSTARRGPATLRFSASRAGFVRFTVQRVVPGRRSGGRCVAPRRGNRGRRCLRFVAVRGSFTLPATAGANRTRFTGRLRQRALRPARYRLVATPLSTQQRTAGTAEHAAFRILRRRAG